MQDKSAAMARVKFVNCSLRNTANNRMYADAWTPIWIQARQPAATKKPGGIDFVDCSVEDDHDRPAIMAGLANDVAALFDVTGKLKVRNPFGARADLGKKLEGVTLVVEEK